MKQNISFKTLLIVVFSASSVCYSKGQVSAPATSKNFSARNNYLYNAKEILSAYERRPSDQTNEAFLSILPVFGSRPIAEIEMEAVIRKARFILNHKNRSKYIPAAQVLLSRAYFNNRDFNSSLRYAEQTLTPEVLDRDLRMETRILQIRSLIALSKLDEARSAASMLRDEMLAYPNKNAEAHATLAQIHLLDEQYELAKQQLLKSSKLSNSTEDKWRWIHILAQLDEKLGHYQEAKATYKSIIRNSIADHIQLYGALAQIRLNSLSGAPGKSTEQQLLRLTKRSSYEDMLDIIYYTLAENSRTRKEFNQATGYYVMAKRRSQDPELKAMADIRIGDLNLYTAKNYHFAELYYDSALTSISIKPLSLKLKDYANSLRRIARLHQHVPNLDTLVQNPEQLNSSEQHIEPYYEIATIYLTELRDTERSSSIYHSLLKAFPGNPYEKAILQALNQKPNTPIHNTIKNSFVQDRQQSILFEDQEERVKSIRRLALDYRPSIKWNTYVANMSNLSINTPTQMATTSVIKIDTSSAITEGTAKELTEQTNLQAAINKSPSAQYYFAVVIEDPQIRLAPFRFRIGEFNRGRRPELNLKHKVIEFSNCQVIYIGIFKSIEVAEAYLNEIQLQMPAIMKETSGKFEYRILSKEDLEQLEAAEIYKEEKPGFRQTLPHQH